MPLSTSKLLALPMDRRSPGGEAAAALKATNADRVDAPATAGAPPAVGAGADGAAVIPAAGDASALTGVDSAWPVSSPVEPNRKSEPRRLKTPPRKGDEPPATPEKAPGAELLAAPASPLSAPAPPLCGPSLSSGRALLIADWTAVWVTLAASAAANGSDSSFSAPDPEAASASEPVTLDKEHTDAELLDSLSAQKGFDRVCSRRALGSLSS
eukprot:scaffold14925_cov97-Isochrysis_galbana.AAC.6